MANDLVKIGGITFQQNEVLESASKKTRGMSNGKPIFEYTVKTTHGTYSYNNTMNEEGSILYDGKKVSINNCNLFNLKGTDKSDTYVLKNQSFISFSDLTDNETNVDTIVLQDYSNLKKINKNPNDVIVDLTEKSDTYIPLPIHYNNN